MLKAEDCVKGARVRIVKADPKSAHMIGQTGVITHSRGTYTPRGLIWDDSRPWKEGVDVQMSHIVGSCFYELDELELITDNRSDT